MANPDISALRKEYSLRALLESEAASDPLQQFQLWWKEALMGNIEEPNAMTLATCSKDARPSARIVLLKGLSNEGFVFFTNYQSRKGKELEVNPHASLLFFWKELERQVRIEGRVEKAPEEKSIEYFDSRPLESRLGAWSSPQSQVIDGRETLDKAMMEYHRQFSDGKIPKPPHWGGYVLRPALVEFWQGRPNRLHDRLQYTLHDGKWKMERLAP